VWLRRVGEGFFLGGQKDRAEGKNTWSLFSERWKKRSLGFGLGGGSGAQFWGES